MFRKHNFKLNQTVVNRSQTARCGQSGTIVKLDALTATVRHADGKRVAVWLSQLDA